MTRFPASIRLCLAMALALVTLRPVDAAPPNGVGTQCQRWADGPWVQVVGYRERTLRSWGCEEQPGDVWMRGTDRCPATAFAARPAQGGSTVFMRFVATGLTQTVALTGTLRLEYEEQQT